MLNRRGLHRASVLLSLLLAIAFLSAGCGGSAESDSDASPADFYKGKDVKFIVPFAAGGGSDLYARLLAPHLKDALGARSVVVENQDGAGGLIAMNQFAKEDGKDSRDLLIMQGTGQVGLALGGGEGMQYDIRDFSYVGRVNDPPMVLVTGKDSGITSIDDVIQDGGELKTATTGVGSAGHIEATVLNDLLDLNLELIPGYEGTQAAVVALIANDVALTANALESLQGAITDGDLAPLLGMTKDKIADYPDLPIAPELDLSPEKKAVLDFHLETETLTRLLVAPPGVPKDRLEFVRDAFEKVMTDPAVIEEAESRQMVLQYMSGQDVADTVNKLMDDAPEDYVNILQDAF